jgi:hypothetical protein
MNAMWRELCAASSASEDVVIYGWVAITTYGYDVFGARLHGRYYIDTHVPLQALLGGDYHGRIDQ